MHDISSVEPALPPYPLTGTNVWVSSELTKNKVAWRHPLTSVEIADLEHAATRFLSQHQDVGDMTKERFLLGPFASHLAALKQKLLHGIGVEVITGLDLQNYSQEMIAAIFCGIGSHLGRARSQNAQGHILGHVRDTGAQSTDTKTRIYQTAERQTFHTDSADIVGLLCLREAREGGDSLLVSAATIYNKMHALRPDLVRLLFEPIATDRRGEIPSGEKPFMTIPPLNWFKEKLTVFYQRQYIDSAQRFPEAMRLTNKHIEALDLFDQLADDPSLHLRMRLRQGDMQFVYNHSQLHDRTGFVDWPEPHRKRHLYRLWLSPEGDRPLPPYFKQRYGSIEIGNRGGILIDQVQLSAPLI
ncbi:MAG: TauD/TfdA family dioxygenase [Granulosicoccus sp.]|nr:TauD/TfdA family dioxygenase [Granulosicoccus sp.]